MVDNPIKSHPIFNNIEMGMGTWSWGDRLFWDFGREYGEEDLRNAFLSTIKGGITFFDTAEVYGQGKSEIYLGKFIKEMDWNVTVATKFMPFPWRLSRLSLLRALRGSLKRLGLNHVDLYQIHFPFPPLTVETWMDAMIEAHQAGLISAIGVSNYDRQQTLRAYSALTRQGVPLASNQVEYHLLNRKVEKNGLMKQCQELGVTVIAYSPLAQGMLTGKYNSEKPPAGARGGKYNRKFLTKIKPLINLLYKIGVDHDGKTPAQVAINWIISKGAIPIPGIKTVEQVEQNLGALNWRLNNLEIAKLDEMSDQITS
jgi:aryl-alcohol dehydrogenase-like predicted oxidoreductase